MRPDIDLEATVRVLIPFQDGDPMGVTWHGNYFRYMESARSALLDKIGYNYADMTESGYLWPIVDTRVKFIKPSRFGQELDVSATLAEYRNRLKLEYVARDSISGETIMKGYTIQVAVSVGSEELCFESPRVLIEKVQACAR